MINRLQNAGFLELTGGWTASALLTLAVDETVRGDPGRAALVGTGTSASSGQTATIQPETGVRPAAAAGEMIEVQAWAAAFRAGSAVEPVVRLVFRNSGGTQVGAETLTVLPPELAAHGEAVAGVTATYRRAFGRFVAPASTATATLEASVESTASGQALIVALTKPLVGAVPAGRATPLPWDPGSHVDTDLQLPCWPLLRPFQSGPGSEPRSADAAFDSQGADRPSSRRTSFDPARRLNARVRCDKVEKAVLESFWRQTPGDFWIVDPDGGRLCVGSFAEDGAPRTSEARGPTDMVDVGLWLETA